MEPVKITISGKFPIFKNGKLKKPKQVLISVHPSMPQFLHNQDNHIWLESVIEHFRSGPGKEGKSG